MGVETELLGLKNRYDGKEFRVIERDDGTIAVLAGDTVIVDSGVTPVTAVLSGSEVKVFGAVATKKRPCYPRNIAWPDQNYTALQTNGTVALGVGTNPRQVVCTVSATGARVTGVTTLYNLDPTKYYEMSIQVDAVAVASTVNKLYPWFNINENPAEGVRGVLWSTPPVAGQRFGFRFKPAGTSVTVRMGFGGDGAEVAAASDMITFSRLSLGEVASLTGSVLDYSFSAYGPVGLYQHATASAASCFYAIGDSWSNDTLGSGATGPANGVEWVFALSNKYNREAVATAVAGKRLDELLTLTTTAVASTAALNPPNLNIPGTWVIAAGLNDIMQGATAATIKSRRDAIAALAYQRGADVLTIIQPFASNAAQYTAGKMAERAAYIVLLQAAGVRYLDLQPYFINADGTASGTYMVSEAGAWIHPSAAGSAMLADLVELELQKIEADKPIIFNPAKFVL